MIMEERINVAELLKDCPKGMELDCMMYENVELDFIEQNPESIYPIHCLLKLNGGCNSLVFTHNGCSDRHPNAKCVIFPKGKTTWKGFVPPCKYKAGDVLVSENGNIVLLSHIDSNNAVNYHCIITTYGNFRIEENTGIGVGKYYDCVLANEQQRQLMYEKIKSSGYKYNQQLNKLEQLIELKLNDGDIIYNRLQKRICIYYLSEDVVPCIKGCRYNESNIQLQFETLDYPIPIALQDYRLATKDEKEKLFQAIKDNGYKWNAETKTLEKMFKPKFKVGDRIRYKTTNKNDICDK